MTALRDGIRKEATHLAEARMLLQSVHFRIRLNEARDLPTDTPGSTLWILVLINRLGGTQTSDWKSSDGNGMNPRLAFDRFGDLLARPRSFKIG